MLRILALSVGLTLWLAVSLEAADIKLDSMKVASQTYSNVTITSFSTADVYFSHSKGVSSAKIRNLEPEVQKLLNYDAGAAKTAEQKQQDAETRYKGVLATLPAAKPRAIAEAEENLSDPISDKSLLGKRGPGLEVEKWLGTEPKLEGKFILVSFWNSKSQAARKSIPQLNALQAKFPEKLQVVALSNESEKEVQAADETKMGFASAIDSKGKLLSAFGVTSVPYVLLMDPKGTVLYYGHPAALNEKQLQVIFSKPAE